MFDYIAGAVLSTQAVVLYFLVVFVSASVVAGLAIFFGKRLFAAVEKDRAGKEGKKFTFWQAMLAGIMVTAVVVIVFFVIPTVVKDQNWRNKQQTCAKQASYSSPIDDDSDKATPESQDTYRRCLGSR